MSTPPNAEVNEQLLTAIRDINIAQQQLLKDMFALQQQQFALAKSRIEQAEELLMQTEKTFEKAQQIQHAGRKGLLVVTLPLLLMALLVLFISWWLK